MAIRLSRWCLIRRGSSGPGGRERGLSCGSSGARGEGLLGEGLRRTGAVLGWE